MVNGLFVVYGGDTVCRQSACRGTKRAPFKDSYRPNKLCYEQPHGTNTVLYVIINKGPAQTRQSRLSLFVLLAIFFSHRYASHHIEILAKPSYGPTTFRQPALFSLSSI